jgi:hypothetical protein
MTLVRSSCKAGATNLTVNPTTLVVGGCSSRRFVFGILLFCVGLAYPSWDANHDFCLGRIGEQTNPFKQSDEDIEQLLQPNWVSRGNEPIVDVKCHQYFGHSVANSISCNVFIKRLIKPFPDYGIDTHIKHERGEWAPLSNAPLGIKRFPVITPGAAHQFCGVPEMLLEALHPWSDSIGHQNYERSLPIKRIVGLLQIYIDLIERALIAPD